MKTYFLYRYYDVEDRLLYVGITTNFKKRDADHRLKSGVNWHNDARRSDVIDLETYDPSEAKIIEARMIKTERPLHNRTHYKQRMSNGQIKKLLSAIGGIVASQQPIEGEIIKRTLGRGPETFQLNFIDIGSGFYRWK